RACLVASDLLGDALRDASTDHIPHGGTTEIVEEFAFEANRMTRFLPSVPKIFDPPPTTMEYPESKSKASISLSLQGHQGLLQFDIQIDHSAFLILGCTRIETYSVGMQVHVVPGEPQDLLLTPASIIGKGGNRSQW